MRTKIDLIFPVICFFLASCASTPEQKRPQWIDNAQQSYSTNEYLTAVGQAYNRERATENAKANLAEIFFVNVRAQTDSITEATKQQSALGVSMKTRTKLQRNIQTETDQALSGVMISNSWQSPEGQYYALATLGKYKAAVQLSETIAELDSSTADLIDYSIHRAPNQIAGLNALRMARDEQLLREMANLQLKQVSNSGITSSISSSKIEKLIANRLALLTISVKGNNARDKKNIQSGLAKLGISLAEESNLQLFANIDTTEPELINNWYWLRGSYELSIAENGQMISRKRWPVKVSAKHKNQLNLRLQDVINKKTANYLVELISDSPTL